MIAWLSSENVEIPSQDTGAYCQARQRLPEQLLKKLFTQVAQQLQNDEKIYSTLELVKLYEERWDVELDLKYLKTTLGMDVLRNKTPEMVRKELYVFLLAYNLLRSLMWTAGTAYGVSPLRLSLQATRHHLDNFIPQLAGSSGKEHNRIYRTLLAMIVHKLVPERPGRSEPRVRKRRSKAYPVMQHPRCQLRRQLASA